MVHASTPRLSILIPVYNGSATIGPLVEELAGLDVAKEMEVVLVNDGSADDSAAVCRALVQSAPVAVTFINLSRNFGEHNAVMAGLRHCRGEYIITMDDDLQNPPSEVSRLFEYTKDHDFDVVYTAFAKKSDPMLRNLGSRFANWTANLVIDKPAGVYLSSFRCFHRFVAEEICRYDGPYPYVDGLIFQVTQKAGTITVQHLPRTNNTSNYTFRKLVRLWLSLVLNFSVLPLRLATLLGIAAAGLSALGGMVVLYEYLFLDVPVRGWVSLILAVLLFSGVQLLVLGIVGEYLGRQFLAINRKPQSVVRSVDRSEDARQPPEDQTAPGR